MKFDYKIIIGLLMLLVGTFFWKDREVAKWKGQALGVAPPDTVTIVLKPPPVQTEQKAKESRTTYEHRPGKPDSAGVVHDTTYVYKTLKDSLETPLFTLKILVDSRDEIFHYDIARHPIKVVLAFNGDPDIRKGFRAWTEPDIGTPEVDWHGYTPPPAPPRFRFATGLGYGKDTGPIVLGAVAWKSYQVGAFAREKDWGVFAMKTIMTF